MNDVNPDWAVNHIKFLNQRLDYRVAELAKHRFVVEELRNLVTHDHETKQDFINRVNETLKSL